jgi:hypothetical protein
MDYAYKSIYFNISHSFRRRTNKQPLIHDDTVTQRRATGDVREKLKESLKVDTAVKVERKQYTTGDIAMRLGGNTTFFKPVETLRKIKSEVVNSLFSKFR